MASRARHRSSSDEATQAFSDSLVDFFRATRRARGREAAQPAGDGISLAQFHVLEPLAHGPLTNRQLADAADVSSPTATRMIDVLSARGLVERVEDPTDRRAVLISLTRAGQTALQAKLDRYQALRERVAETLDPDERRMAAELLRRLAGVIEEL
jgi:DNA-binding MarR family transcriptional regulator